MKINWKLIGVAIVAALVTQAYAQPKVDTFSVGLTANNELTSYVSDMYPNTGWNDGEWVYYGRTGWWNQWYYDDPPDPTRQKKISYYIDIFLESATGMGIMPEIAINWSTLEYPESGPDGMPPMQEQEQMIEREIIFSDPLDPGMPYVRLEGGFLIPDYNPEWVSIDIRVPDATGAPTPFLIIEGVVEHECIPEPATVCLLFLGGLPLLRRR